MASKSALKPTILMGVTRGMEISDEEAFGPSFSLYTAKDDAEAIRLANETRYGLNAAVHSTNMQHALEVAKEIDTAQIHVNSMTAHDERKLSVKLLNFLKNQRLILEHSYTSSGRDERQWLGPQ